MSTMKERPYRDALNRAVDIFRDAMRPFIVRNMKLVHGGRVEDTIWSSLGDKAQVRFRRLLREGEGVEGAIDISDIPRVVSRRWREVFDVAFSGDRTVQNTLRRIVKARNRTAHVGQRDMELKRVRHCLYDIADVLGRIDAPVEKLAVEKIRDSLPPGPEDSASPDQSSYWLNTIMTPVVLHKGTCVHVGKWAPSYPDNWTKYPTEQAARRSTLRRIKDCGICF